MVTVFTPRRFQEPRMSMQSASRRLGSLLMLAAVVAAACAAAASASAADEGLTVMTVSPPTLIAGRTDEPVKIDGDLSEPAWQAAKPSGGFTVMLDSSMQAQQPTAVRAMYDKDNLYLALVCDEPNVANLVKLAETRDEPSFTDDRVEVVIGVPGSKDSYYSFALTAGNVQSDARCRAYTEPFVVYTPTERVNSTKSFHDVDADWNAVWPSAVAEGESQWTVEMAVPLAAIGVDPDNVKVIRANFDRVRVTYTEGRRGRRLNVKPEDTVWSPPKGDVGTPALFGFIALADADGNAPSTPASIAAAVPGMPGMPGVPNDEPTPRRARFTVKADQPGRKLPRFWDSINMGRIRGGPLADAYAKGHLTQMRCGSGWPRNATIVNGKLEGDMSSIDALFDTLKEENIRPVVTLHSRPAGIEYETITSPRWGRVSGPPKDEKDYVLIHDAYKSYFQYVFDRYGQEYFDTIRFEFWNEPDGSDRFFAGTVNDYFIWYSWVAKALKDVSPTGKIGGPAVTGGGFDFTKTFLGLCHDGDNPATGGKGAPVDFLSFHTYGWRAQLTPYASQDTILTMGRFWKILKDTGFGGIEVQVTEWGIEPTGDASGPYYWFRKTHYAPVWMARLVKQADDAAATYKDDLGARIDGLSLCQFGGRGSVPFPGTRTLFTAGNVPKPYYNGYVLLSELGGERLPADGPASQDIACMPTRRADGSLAILVFHFKEYQKTSPPEMDTVFELAGLPTEGVKISQMRVDENTSNSYTAWVKMGSPEEITDDIAARLTAAAEVRKTPLKANDAGLVELNMPVNSVAVVIVEKDRPAQTAPAAPAPTTETAPAE
jgi:xylan 1,4-beta-xylosidase